MHPKDAAGIANSVDSDQTAQIWVCTVCPDLSVQKLRIITVMLLTPVLSSSYHSNVLSEETSKPDECQLLKKGDYEEHMVCDVRGSVRIV